MTYYEELGVPQTASRKEIRQAHTRLTESIRPDECAHLNSIVNLLLDSRRRGRYDRSLAALAYAVSGEPPPELSYPLALPRWIGPMAVAGAAATLLLLLVILPVSPPDATAPVATVTSNATVEPSRTQPVEQDTDWEPLATYAYSSHLPVPPLAFSEQPAVPPAGDAPQPRAPTRR